MNQPTRPYPYPRSRKQELREFFTTELTAIVVCLAAPAIVLTVLLTLIALKS